MLHCTRTNRPHQPSRGLLFPGGVERLHRPLIGPLRVPCPTGGVTTTRQAGPLRPAASLRGLPRGLRSLPPGRSGQERAYDTTRVFDHRHCCVPCRRPHAPPPPRRRGYIGRMLRLRNVRRLQPAPPLVTDRIPYAPPPLSAGCDLQEVPAVTPRLFLQPLAPKPPDRALERHGPLTLAGRQPLANQR